MKQNSDRSVSTIENQFAKPIKNYYEILNVQPDASSQEIRDAFFRLKSVYMHSNQALYSLVSDDEATDTLSDVEEAYHILTNDQQRSMFDKSLNHLESRPQPIFNHSYPSETKSEEAHHDQMSFEELYSASQTSDKPFVEPKPEPSVRTSEPEKPLGVWRKTTSAMADNERISEKIGKYITNRETTDGEILKNIRELRCVALSEMQEHTKVSIDYLEAIEENLFERLPQKVYVKGFVSSYLRYLGIKDHQKLVAEYIKGFEDWQTKDKSR